MIEEGITEKQDEKEEASHVHSWRDAWLKNNYGTRHVVYCVICNEVKKDES